jgi:hypothetical protein
VAELEPMISALIKENRELHRQIDKLSCPLPEGPVAELWIVP